MKLKIARNDLVELLARGGSSAARNAAIPILGHVRLTASADRLEVTSCNTDLQSRASGPAAVEVAGDVTVPAAALKTIVDRLPAGCDLSLTLDGADMIVKSGRSRLRLPTLPVDAFPSLDATMQFESATFDLSGADLDLLLAKTSAIGALDKTRTNLHCVYLHPSKGADGPALTAVATNGHILLREQIPLPEGAVSLPAGGVMLPIEAIEAALRLFKAAPSVRLVLGTNRAEMSIESTSLVTKLVDGDYPDYQRVIPKEGPASVTLDRASTVATLALLDAFASGDQGRKIECAPTDGGLGIAAGSATDGDGYAVAGAEIGGEVPVFGLSILYLRMMLGAFRSDWIRLSLSDPGAPILATASGETTVGVLMPMRTAGTLVKDRRNEQA
jgi:DNA polymerase-3 subunit beta